MCANLEQIVGKMFVKKESLDVLVGRIVSSGREHAESILEYLHGEMWRNINFLHLGGIHDYNLFMHT